MTKYRVLEGSWAKDCIGKVYETDDNPGWAEALGLVWLKDPEQDSGHAKFAQASGREVELVEESSGLVEVIKEIVTTEKVVAVKLNLTREQAENLRGALGTSDHGYYCELEDVYEELSEALYG